jgi:hypothetical protein
MSDKALRNQLIRVAHSLPKNSRERALLVDLLRAHVPLVKVAAQKTEEFVEWVFNSGREPMTGLEIERFLTAKLGMDIKEPLKKREGPRFMQGDRVKVDASKHKDEVTMSTYAEYDKKLGVVVSTDGMDALVKLDSGPSEAIRFVDALKPRGVGLMKHTPAYVVEGSKAIEMVYLTDPDGAVTGEQRLVVEQYLGRGRGGEKRSANYYTGHLFNARYNAQGQPYFQMFPQQRTTIDPEGGYQARSFNPLKGKVLYIGLLGKRPSGWEDELEEIRNTRK